METRRDQLTHITIKGFKSIKNCHVELKKLNVLIGSNGAGKTNFICAFAMLQNILEKNLQIYAAQSGINSLFYKSRKITEKISFETFFGNNSYGFDLIPTDDNRLVFEKEYFGFYGTYANKTSVGCGNFESVWEKGTNNHISDYVIPVLCKRGWKVYHFHDTGRSARVKQEHNISNNEALLFDAANLAAFLYRLKNHYKNSYDKIVKTVRLVAPYFWDFVLEPQEGNSELIVLKWKQTEYEDIFNASALSDGTLRFICLATLLLQPQELAPVTIIIDEPELGLHPFAIAVFSELAKQVSERTQVIISTQSVEMLDQFNAEDVITVENSTEGSVFRRLNEKDLESWLEDYSLGELWNKNILGGRLSR